MMWLAVVAVAAMLMVGVVSAMAKVEEAAMVAAEKADKGQGGWRLCTVVHFSPIFFLTVTATTTDTKATVQSLTTRHILGVLSLLLPLMHCCWCWRWCWCWRCYHCCHHSCFCRSRCFRHHHCCCHRHFFCCPFWFIVVCAPYCCHLSLP